MARYTGRHRPLPTGPTNASVVGGGLSRHRFFAPVVVVAVVAGVGVGALGLATAVKAGQSSPLDASIALASQAHTNFESVVALTASRAQQRVSRDVTRAAVGAALVERSDGARAKVKMVASAAVAADRAKVAAAERARVEAEQKRRQAAIADAQSDPKAVARALMADHGWTGDEQYACLVNLWTGESNWRWSAQNASSGAYGIPQSLPASKMAQFGADYRTNPVTQMKWGLWYIEASYGSPCSAWAFWQTKSPHWY